MCVANAGDQLVLRMGTGGGSGAYFPIGSLIAESLNDNSNSNSSEYLHSSPIILPQRSSGSVANVHDISNKLLEAGLAQADVVHWAYHGTGPFSQEVAMTKLRVIATLYLESLHLVAHVDSGIDSVADLVGHRVSVDEIGSGTELDVRPILKAFEISKGDLNMVFLKPADSIERMRMNQLDAFFIVAGYPVSGVSELIEEGIAKLVPIAGPIIEALLNEHPFLTVNIIPADAYSNDFSVPTLAVAAQMIITEDVDDDIAFNITKKLWSDKTINKLTNGHRIGKDIDISSALRGVGIPLHKGAHRYYEGVGLLMSDLPY